MSYDNSMPQNIIYILDHKEEYSITELTNTIQWLRENNYYIEANGLENYINSLTYDNDEYYDSEHKGSQSNIWTTYLKISCYICLIILTILGFIIGSSFGNPSYNLSKFIMISLIGGGIGFIIGFISVAIIMAFVTLCENISTIADNTAKLLYKLDETNSLIVEDIDNNTLQYYSE